MLLLGTTSFSFCWRQYGSLSLRLPVLLWVSDFGTFEQLSETNLLKGLAGAGGSIDIDHGALLLGAIVLIGMKYEL